jgi:hypothetical protein
MHQFIVEITLRMKRDLDQTHMLSAGQDPVDDDFLVRGSGGRMAVGFNASCLKVHKGQ